MAKCKRCEIKTVLSQSDIEKMVDEVKAMHGIRLVSKETYDERYDICTKCDRLIYNSTCSACGCVVQVRAMLKDGRCPDKKWL